MRASGKRASFEDVARAVLRGDEEVIDEESRREIPKKLVTQPRVSWVERHLRFWDDQPKVWEEALAEQLRERKQAKES